MKENKLYTSILSNKVVKQLNKLENQVAQTILEAIFNLEENPRPNGYIKLKWEEYYKIRVGDYRVIYDIQDKILVINVITLGHRKDMYK
jgi:mRNA interferase RelE/StbE